jgi:hypothetical protein
MVLVPHLLEAQGQGRVMLALGQGSGNLAMTQM